MYVIIHYVFMSGYTCRPIFALFSVQVPIHLRLINGPSTGMPQLPSFHLQ